MDGAATHYGMVDVAENDIINLTCILSQLLILTILYSTLYDCITTIVEANIL